LHAGAYYVQEASSMFLEHCIRQSIDLSQSLKVLDLCAAPGGKSSLILSLISTRSLLVSNEVIKTRVNVLIENLSKWGAANTIVTNNDPRDFRRLTDYFDMLVIDAPCSGSGLFRRDPDAIAEWNPEAVDMCSLRQQRILTDSYEALKQTGILIYSTCSYSIEENEAICDWLCENHQLSIIPLDIPDEWNIVKSFSPKFSVPCYRFFPDHLKGEGFFVACFRKNDGGLAYTGKWKKNLSELSVAETQTVSKWLQDPSEVNMYHLENKVFAFPENLREDLFIVHSNLYIKKAGVSIGKLIKNDVVPAHELALSTIINKELFSISLKKNEALQYLRKEEVTVDTIAKGWALVRYEDQNLGWVKLLSNRANNYYPKEWRILKSGIE
jgi:NOL1/NOP2/fmu family ribosome biogenesis protein